jgi:hypothetical protein
MSGMNVAIWILMAQACLGAFDTLYYHEYRLKLAHSSDTKAELRLHAVRDYLYALIIGTLGFVTWNGPLAWLLFVALLTEIVITLNDFVEEDRVRKLPPGERVMHGIMGIVYGAFLAYLLPEMWRWQKLSAGFGPAYHGFPAWVLAIVALGVFGSGVRDLAASFGYAPDRAGRAAP